VAKTASGDLNAGLALFSQLVGPEKAHYNVAYLLRQEGKTEAAVQECHVALRINPKFEPAKVMLAQIHDRQVADALVTAPGKPPAGTATASPIQTSLGATQAPAGPGVGGTFAASASQASWQPPSRPVTGTLPLTSGDASFDSAPPQPPAPPAPRPGVPATAGDPWANFSP
jgi:hypothetical protein